MLERHQRYENEALGIIYHLIGSVGKRSALAELTCKHRWSLLDYYYSNYHSARLLAACWLTTENTLD